MKEENYQGEVSEKIGFGEVEAIADIRTNDNIAPVRHRLIQVIN